MKNSKAKGIERKRIFFIINIVLVIVLAVLLWQRFYKKTGQFQLKYGEEPKELTAFIERQFNVEWKQPGSIIYVFNNLPVLSDISDITKLHRKHRKHLDFFVVFHRKFKLRYPLGFPYEFLSNVRTEISYDGATYDGNFFVLLKERRVSHFDTPQKILDMNFLIEKQIFPGKDYKDYAISGSRLKKRLTKKLIDGNLSMMHLSSNKNETFSNFKEYTKIYFIVGGCTSCELKRLVSELKLRQLLDSKKELVIFPIFADESELRPVVKDAKLELPVYVDYNDQFELFSIITGKNNKLITINASELNMAEGAE